MALLRFNREREDEKFNNRASCLRNFICPGYPRYTLSEIQISTILMFPWAVNIGIFTKVLRNSNIYVENLCDTVWCLLIKMHFIQIFISSFSQYSCNFYDNVQRFVFRYFQNIVKIREPYKLYCVLLLRNYLHKKIYYRFGEELIQVGVYIILIDTLEYRIRGVSIFARNVKNIRLLLYSKRSRHVFSISIEDPLISTANII